MNKNYNTELLPEDIVRAMKKNIYLNYLNFTSYSDINQKYLNARSSIFSLIHKISNKMNFKSSTYFLSIYYLDVIFLKDEITYKYNNSFELLGLSCLVLAAKHLENDPTVPHLKHFVNAYDYITKQIIVNSQSDNMYNYANISINDLFFCEVIVCKLLDYKLNYFTIYDFNSFFFGHGILKIEQLTDITEDFHSRFDENDFEDDDELNYIDPDLVKKILEKIYKKSRYFLDNVVKNRISLKYNSFLISIYIMYKSVEYVILKENKIISTDKSVDNFLIEKKEDLLRRKTSKCFKDIMRDIYKINLDSIEEYHYLINDDEILDIFSPLKYNINIGINTDKNEFDISAKIDKIHRKYQSNNIDKVIKKYNKTEKSETVETKDFSPKKITHMKIPSGKYNKIRRLKILERLNNNTSKNKLLKSFVHMNSKGDIYNNKINTSINFQNSNREILSKSNYHKDFQYYNHKNNKNRTINTDNYNSKYIESYKEGKKAMKQYKYDTSFKRNSNLKDILTTENNSYYKNTTEDKRRKKYNLEDSQYNKNSFNPENRSNNNLINLNEKGVIKNKNNNLTISIKPYSRKVIPKVEKRNKNSQNISKNDNLLKDSKDISNISSSFNKINISYKDNNNSAFTSKNLDLRSNNINKYNNKLIGNDLNDSIEKKKVYSTNLNSNYGRINLNMVKKAKESNDIPSVKQNKKNKARFLLQNDYKKLSLSVNKIKVNGVSNKHKLNKKLIFGMHKTPMKTENILNNAIKRNIGVKRENNNSIFNNYNSLDNSIDAPNKNNEKNKNNDNKNISFFNFASKKDLKIKKIESNKKIINLKNDSNNENIQNSSKSLIKDKINNIEMSSSSEGDDSDANDNNIELSNVRINQLSDNNIEKYIDKIKYKNEKRYKINKLFDNEKKNKKEKNMPKIELIQINKKKSPTIVINNNINVNFDNKSIGEAKPFSKLKIK